MNFWSFVINALPVISDVFKTPSLQSAMQGALGGVVDALVSKAHDPAALKTVAADIKSNLPSIVGAIVKGTPAEGMVSPAIIPAPPGDRPATG